MAEDAGVEIPKGHPDRLREAGTGWAALAEVLSDQATRMESASGIDRPAFDKYWRERGVGFQPLETP
jgi:hypothetical protein